MTPASRIEEEDQGLGHHHQHSGRGGKLKKIHKPGFRFFDRLKMKKKRL